MKNIIIIILVVLTYSSCQSDNNTNIEMLCDVSNPIKNLAWLEQRINDSDEFTYYESAIYLNQTVFINWNCNPLVDYQSNVYDCEGKFVGYTNELINDLTEREVLWRHPKTKCSFNE